MELLGNYAPCFINGEDVHFQPYFDAGALKILCATCHNEARTETNGVEKRFYCDCYADDQVGFSCSFSFYDEMVAAAASTV